jgi:VanZ family protein
MTTPGPLTTERKAGRAWLLVLLWTAALWWLGSDIGSLNATSRFIGPLLRWLLPEAPQSTLNQIHFFLRKGDHVGGYGVLALLTWRALLASTRAATLRPALLALAWVLSVGTCDEIRQASSRQRTGSAWDVALDVCGGLLVLALALAYTRRMRARRTAPERG